jgi:predicted metal-dependent peptidase
MQNAANRVSIARTHLLLDQPWFGSLSMRLHVEEDPSVPTMATDGTVLKYNSEFVNSLRDKQLIGLIAHEVMHCALQHPYRLAGRDLKQWNIACDLAINPLLTQQGFELWDGALNEDRFKGMSAEQIYATRAQEARDNPGQPEPEPQPGEISTPSQPDPNGDQDNDQDGDQDGDGEGEGDDADQDGSGDANGEGDGEGEGQGDGSGKPQQMTAVDWQIATEQASAIAKKAGKMPGDVDRTVKSNRESETNWREILRRFVEQNVPSDYSWTNPNRRHVANGVYLPGMVKKNTPRFVVAVDTSRSIGQTELDICASELTSILHETRPESIDVIYCDWAVQHTESFSPDDPEIKLNAKGGGGTAFQPVFDYVAEQDEPPAALIYFTDLYGDNPTEPEYPVLWVTTEATRMQGPFGETVRLSQWQ